MIVDQEEQAIKLLEKKKSKFLWNNLRDGWIILYIYSYYKLVL